MCLREYVLNKTISVKYYCALLLLFLTEKFRQVWFCANAVRLSPQTRVLLCTSQMPLNHKMPVRRFRPVYERLFNKTSNLSYGETIWQLEHYAAPMLTNFTNKICLLLLYHLKADGIYWNITNCSQLWEDKQKNQDMNQVILQFLS